MAAMTSFHTEECCHLVSAQAPSTQCICSSILHFRIHSTFVLIYIIPLKCLFCCCVLFVIFVYIRSPPANSDVVITLPKLSTTLVGETPDASDWSVADVAKYFTDIGFVVQAETFRAEVSISCLIFMLLLFLQCFDAVDSAIGGHPYCKQLLLQSAVPKGPPFATWHNQSNSRKIGLLNVDVCVSSVSIVHCVMACHLV